MKSWNGQLHNMRLMASAALGVPDRIVERATCIIPHKRYFDGGSDVIIGYRQMLGDGKIVRVLWDYRKGCARILPDDGLPLCPA